MGGAAVPLRVQMAVSPALLAGWSPQHGHSSLLTTPPCCTNGTTAFSNEFVTLAQRCHTAWQPVEGLESSSFALGSRWGGQQMCT